MRVPVQNSLQGDPCWGLWVPPILQEDPDHLVLVEVSGCPWCLNHCTPKTGPCPLKGNFIKGEFPVFIPKGRLWPIFWELLFQGTYFLVSVFRIETKINLGVCNIIHTLHITRTASHFNAVQPLNPCTHSIMAQNCHFPICRASKTHAIPWAHSLRCLCVMHIVLNTWNIHDTHGGCGAAHYTLLIITVLEIIKYWNNVLEIKLFSGNNKPHQPIKT